MSFFNFRDKEWDIMGKKYYLLALSGILILVSVISFVTQGLHLGLDFQGGTICELRFDQPKNTEEIRNALVGVKLGEVDMSNCMVQQSQSDNRIVLIRTKYLEQSQIEELYNLLETKLGRFERLSSSGIGPTMGEQVMKNAGKALLIVLLLQLVYITIRFSNNYLYGLAVDIALIHDIIIMVGLYSVLGFEADSPFLAAILTVVGYSVMDTIVIFDRVRENRLLLRKVPFEKLINKSILQTLTRSVYTLLTVVICLVCLLIFGGSTLRSFAVALLIGVVSGAYSSIFIACPFVVLCENWSAKQKNLSREKVREQLAIAKKKVDKTNGKSTDVEDDDEDLEETVASAASEGSPSVKKKRKKK